uniref:Uncharacterized protein n=1 Tax=Mucochytrium quahogii TaxID=96639 RepID=A0A7S2S6N3_9STRA|mmetsp:Transcript_25555/g.55425  ORF Transcript_25555/g.55425 Transcript_25555/m.55425 type:complete len:427 (+) Transcript_25555:190-1470(+)
MIQNPRLPKYREAKRGTQRWVNFFRPPPKHPQQRPRQATRHAKVTEEPGQKVTPSKGSKQTSKEDHTETSLHQAAEIEDVSHQESVVHEAITTIPDQQEVKTPKQTSTGKSKQEDTVLEKEVSTGKAQKQTAFVVTPLPTSKANEATVSPPSVPFTTESFEKKIESLFEQKLRKLEEHTEAIISRVELAVESHVHPGVPSGGESNESNAKKRRITDTPKRTTKAKHKHDQTSKATELVSSEKGAFEDLMKETDLAVFEQLAAGWEAYKTTTAGLRREIESAREVFETLQETSARKVRKKLYKTAKQARKEAINTSRTSSESLLELEMELKKKEGVVRDLYAAALEENTKCKRKLSKVAGDMQVLVAEFEQIKSDTETCIDTDKEKVQTSLENISKTARKKLANLKAKRKKFSQEEAKMKQFMACTF